MAIKSKMSGVGFSTHQAGSIAGSGDTALTATGSSAGTALLLSSHHNAFGTVGSSTGGILSTQCTAGDQVYVYNGGVSTLTIYPPTGATIDNTTSASIVTKKGAWFVWGTDTAIVSHGST
jgi:hypothetical protein